MLKDVIETLGATNVAKTCGVTPGCVSHWKRQGYLPGRGPRADRRGAMYEKKIARLAGCTVKELRAWIERQEAA